MFGFFKSGDIILFTVPEFIRLCTYLSHLSSESAKALIACVARFFPSSCTRYKIRKPAPLKIKGIQECGPLESAIKTAYWEGLLIVQLSEK